MVFEVKKVYYKNVNTRDNMEALLKDVEAKLRGWEDILWWKGNYINTKCKTKSGTNSKREVQGKIGFSRVPVTNIRSLLLLKKSINIGKSLRYTHILYTHILTTHHLSITIA